MNWDQLKDYTGSFFSLPLIRLQNDRLRVDAVEASVGALSTVGLCWMSYSARRVGFGVVLSLTCPKPCFCVPVQQAFCPGWRSGSGVQPCPRADLAARAACTAALRVQAQRGWERLMCPGLLGCARVSFSHRSPRDASGSLVILPFTLYLGTPTLAQFFDRVCGKSTFLLCK